MGLLKDLATGKKHICVDCKKTLGTILIKNENPNNIKDHYICNSCFQKRTNGSNFITNGGYGIKRR